MQLLAYVIVGEIVGGFLLKWILRPYLDAVADQASDSELNAGYSTINILWFLVVSNLVLYNV